MVAKIMEFVKDLTWEIKRLVFNYQQEIILFLAAILISLLSFAMGYIMAKQGTKEPIIFEQSAGQNK